AEALRYQLPDTALIARTKPSWRRRSAHLSPSCPAVWSSAATRRTRIRTGEVSTLPSRGPKRHLVAAARFDELLGRAATVGVSVGHGAAQLLDGWGLRCGLFGPLAFPAVQVGFGSLAGGEE